MSSPAPALPPLNPGLRYGNQFYAIVQEVRTFTVPLSVAQERCSPLATQIVATVEPVSYALTDVPACAGFTMANVVSCMFTTPQESTIDDFVAWVNTNPFESVAGTCSSMRVAKTGRVILENVPDPPLPPDPPKPPGPPPRPLPSPPPPPPSPPPQPPGLPHPPHTPPQLPPSPPAPPDEPPAPPSPPTTVQIASQPLCHPTCVSVARLELTLLNQLSLSLLFLCAGSVGGRGRVAGSRCHAELLLRGLFCKPVCVR